MQAKEIERLNGVYKKLLNSNGVDMYGECLTKKTLTSAEVQNYLLLLALLFCT